ncbi:MAG: hypothetical protein IJQ26_04620, partial [Lachnospiraceae bacterium]|nr:hypothetical protein [Lachnospiraceae bacterium]
MNFLNSGVARRRSLKDAFSSGAECPICYLYNQLEENAVAFMMGPSYMEDDVRMETNEKGF